MNYCDRRRLEIVKDYLVEDKYCGGIMRFEGMPFDTLTKLFEEDFIDENDRQNEAPTASEIYWFIRDNEGINAGGYIVSPDRDDYRVTIDSIEGEFEEDNIDDLRELIKDADDIRLDGCNVYAWWD